MDGQQMSDMEGNMLKRWATIAGKIGRWAKNLEGNMFLTLLEKMGNNCRLDGWMGNRVCLQQVVEGSRLECGPRGSLRAPLLQALGENTRGM